MVRKLARMRYTKQERNEESEENSDGSDYDYGG